MYGTYLGSGPRTNFRRCGNTKPRAVPKSPGSPSRTDGWLRTCVEEAWPDERTGVFVDQGVLDDGRQVVVPSLAPQVLEGIVSFHDSSKMPLMLARADQPRSLVATTPSWPLLLSTMAWTAVLQDLVWTMHGLMRERRPWDSS